MYKKIHATDFDYNCFDVDSDESNAFRDYFAADSMLSVEEIIKWAGQFSIPLSHSRICQIFKDEGLTIT
tara:strand:+ start:1897 stop:2103 length:207 start_codon:yes stop_codon:yes gene_type:complete